MPDVDLLIVLLASAMGLLAKAGADIPPATLAAVPLGLAAAVWLVHVVRRARRMPAIEAA